jgi:serine/threonine protein kinase
MSDAMGRIETPECTYCVSREVGRGSFGKVAAATRVDRDGRRRDVAIKFGRRGEENEMRREWRMLGSAKHPHVLEVLGFLSEADVCASTSPALRRLGPGVVSPAADIDLGAFIRRHGAVHVVLSAAWAADVAEALAHLHSIAILHRDIKPSNLLLFFHADDGKVGGFVRSTVKVADFGSARKMPPLAGARHRIRGKEACDPWQRHLRVELPAMTALVATAWYRAPEFLHATMTPTCLDAVSADPQRCGYGAPMDVWSYGAVLWEMLEGRPLVFAATGSGVMQCLVRALGPCPDAGQDAPTFAQTEAWRSLVRYMPERPEPMLWPTAAPWQVVKACLQWRPQDRATMAGLRGMPWFAAPAHAPEPRGSQMAAARCASTPATGTASTLLGGFDVPIQHEALSKKSTCACAGHCRVGKHRREGKCESKTLVAGTD